MRRYPGLALAFVLAAVSFSALAMGLGEIRLNSYLNQRLDAEIELVSAAADEIESLEISLADAATFERYGLVRGAMHNSLRFEVVRRPNGTAYIKVTSTEPIREPFLTMLVVADWSRGRLMREYTLLIDPPAFASREHAPAPEPVQAPDVTPAPSEQPSRPIQRPEPVAEQPSVEETRGDVISIPPLEADAEPVRREPEFAKPQLGGNYGPIQRNETLWGIAKRLRPDTSITINQMMIALFRANPEAFQGNINRLKAGYVLRIPEYSEVTALARRDAFNEVKRQNDEWRYGDSPEAAPSQPVAAEVPEPVEAEPELNLVAPEETPESTSGDLAGTGLEAEGEPLEEGFGAEDPLDLAGDDVDENAVELGVEDDENTDDRLLDFEDESMQALQEQEEPLTADDVLEGAEPVVVPPVLSPETTDESTADPAADTPATEEPVEDPAAGEADTSAEPEQAPPPVVAPFSGREPSLVDKLTSLAASPLGMGIGAAILVLLLAGFLVVRKRREAAAATTTTVVTDWDDTAGDEAAIVVGDEDDLAIADENRSEDGLEETQILKLDDEAATRLDEEQAEQDNLLDTMTGGQPVTLDDNDPLSEADFHMAYGLYDQAAEVVQKAVDRDPSRKDYLTKLAEIHFAANNTEGFLEAAHRLKDLAGPGDPDWDNVAIMGRQIAPGNELFSEGGSASSVDLDFNSAADEFETATPEAPAPAAPVDDSLDFDISLDNEADVPETTPPETPPAVPESNADALDFDLDAGATETPEEPAPTPPEPGTDTGNDFDFDLGELDTASGEIPGAEDRSSGDLSADESRESSESYGDEQTQTEFDKALEELSAFVDTNLPEQDAGDAVEETDGELNLDDYSFDEDAGLGEESVGTGEDEEDIGEIGTKLDLARAYIDMGDPDGARGILEEVVSDGDADQQKEARELLDQLA